MDYEGAHRRAVSIWLRFNRVIDLDDLKSQAVLLSLQGKEGRALWCDLFDYAEYEYRRRPIKSLWHEPRYRWHPEMCGIVRRAAESLPEQQREVIRLVFFEDRLQTEAALEMGVHKTRVTHLMQRALRTLKERLAA